MRSIPVKETAFVGLMCVMAPEPRVVNIETGEVRKDRATGVTVWSVQVVALRGRDSSVIRVDVVGEPHGVVLGGPVRVVDLEAVPWERDGRSGVSWRAGAVLPADTGPGLTGAGPAASGVTSGGTGSVPSASGSATGSGRRSAGDAT